MTIDLSTQTGFNGFLDRLITRFRDQAINSELDGGNLDAVNQHVEGPINTDQLSSQYAYPILWSVPQTYSTAYDTVASDHGELQIQVIVVASDADPKVAFEKARVVIGRVIGNVERSALVDAGEAAASNVRLENLQLDFEARRGGNRAQLRYAQAVFGIDAERRVRKP